jgi:hypothetical protein
MTTTTSHHHHTSGGGIVQHILNVSGDEPSITLHTKFNTDNGKIKLKSVEEDIDIIHPNGDTVHIPITAEDGANKSFVTVVKTTKVTTKVNKKHGGKKQNSKRVSKSRENVVQVGGSDDSSDDAVIAAGGLDANVEIPIVKVDVNRQTEEYMFETVPSSPSHRHQTVTTTTVSSASSSSTHQHQQHQLHTTTFVQQQQQQQQQNDLNSTVLDSEDILSTYSGSAVPAQSPRRVLPVQNDADGSTVIRIQTEEINIPVVIAPAAISVAPQLPSKTEKPKKEKKEKKSKSDEPSKSPKTRCFQLRPTKKSAKRKAEKLDEATASTTAAPADQQQPSKQLKVDTGDQVVTTSAPLSTASDRERHVLIDDEQKDRIVYLKPESVELVVDTLLKHDDNGELAADLTPHRAVLAKMVSRALDLLRRDRMESFDKLAGKLRTEYKLDEEPETVSKAPLRRHNELVFATRLREYLVDQRLLLVALPLDKQTAARVCEENIDFRAGVVTAAPRRVVLDQAEPVRDEIVAAVVVTDAKPPADQEVPAVADETSAVVENKKDEDDFVIVEPADVADYVAVEGDRVVLSTISEPPIVFQCDLKKPDTVQVAVEKQPATVAVVIVDNNDQKPAEDTIQKGRKSTARKSKSGGGSSLLCCGPLSSRKSKDELDEAKKPKKEKKQQQQQQQPKSAVVVNVNEAKPLEVAAAEPVVLTQRETVHIDFSNLDRAEGEPLLKTVDFPTILSVEPAVFVAGEESPQVGFYKFFFI